MTYYEEFGIPTSATPDEIHQAHRRLIKILHPDLQIEEKARQLAEVQTRRINGIAEILLDSDKKLEYEASLIFPRPFGPGLRMARFPSKNQWGSLANFVITGIFVLAGLWILESDRPVAAHQADSQPSTVSKAASHSAAGRAVAHPTRSDPDLGTLHERRERDRNKTDEDGGSVIASSAPVELPPPIELHPTPPAVDPVEPVRSEVPESRGAATLPVIEHVDRTSRTPDNPFLGTWVYLPVPPAPDDQPMYRPEYIEMRVHEVKGLLEGNYRARYHVPDRPLSPNVGFHFTGPLKERSGAFHWKGANGLAGDVTLNLLGANSIQVDWKVTELAESADLVSGTAVLTRVR